MAFSKQYIGHLEREWRVIAARVEDEDGKHVLCLVFARSENTVVFDRINMVRDTERLAEFKEAVGDYGELEGLLDRRIGIVFEDRFSRGIIGYRVSFHPLSACWPSDRPC